MTITTIRRLMSDLPPSLLWIVALMIVCAAGRVDARDDKCDVVNESFTPVGAVIQISYELRAPAGVKACRVKLTVSPDPEVMRGDIGDVPIGKGKSVRVQFRTAPARPDAIKLQWEAVPLHPWHLGAALFSSLDARQGTAALGTHQAVGGLATIGIPRGSKWEVGFEVSSPLWKQALDSEEVGSSAVQQLLRDTFFSVTIGPTWRVGSRAQIVPLVGGGVALVQTRRFTHSLSGTTVVTVVEDESKTALGLTAGADLRFALAGGVRFVAGYRGHALAGAKDVAARPDFQHRLGIGIQVELGAR